MKKIAFSLLLLLFSIALLACGQSSIESDPPFSDDIFPSDFPSEGLVEEPVNENEDSSFDLKSIALGQTLSTNFVEIVFDQFIVAEDIQYAVKTDNVTRISGPAPISGQQFVCLSGTITSWAKTSLPVFDFFIGEFSLDGYTYTVNSQSCDILDGEGNTLSKIEPLMEYTIRIYTAIPNALANSYSSGSFRFGFFDMFANDELSKLPYLNEDPISLCPYQFIIETDRSAPLPPTDENTQESDDKEEPSSLSAKSIVLGQTIVTDFVEIVFNKAIITEDARYAVTTGPVTRISGPAPIAGQQFICLSGTIKNLSPSKLPVFDFFLGEFLLDGYTYAVDAKSCDILDGEGNTLSYIDPLLEYTIRIYTAIPDSLANHHSQCTFRFGFDDLFDNKELSWNQSFEKDPIALCPYQYILNPKDKTDGEGGNMSDETNQDSNKETNSVITDAKYISLGQTITTDFVEIVFSEVLVAEDVQYIVTTGSTTFITGPEPIAGRQFICLSGKIKNLSKNPLPMFDFFLGEFSLDGYTYPVNTSNCDILDSMGRLYSQIDPLMDYMIRIYVAIPPSLANDLTERTFRLGFDELFANDKLSQNKKDPISFCPYQFVISLPHDFKPNCDLTIFSHNYVGEITTNPTCGTDGMETFTCTRCHHSYSEAIPKTGKHTADPNSFVWEQNPNPSQNKVVHFTCSSCSEIIYHDIPIKVKTSTDKYICQVCNLESCPVCKDTGDLWERAKEAGRISQLTLEYQEETDNFVLSFSRFAMSEYEIASPDLMYLAIINDKQEVVYDYVWLYLHPYYFQQWTDSNGVVHDKITIYISRSSIKPGTSTSGTLYCEVGIITYEDFELKIDGYLPAFNLS